MCLTMRISSLYKQFEGDDVKFIRKVQYKDGSSKEMWISCNKEMAIYYNEERADSYLVSLLIPAMIRNESIEIDSPISESLYFNLTKYLIPFLVTINSNLHIIEIICNTIPDYCEESSRDVGTGISCGVDSLSTILYHIDNKNSDSYNISCLTLFNSGYYGKGDNAQSNFEQYKDRSIRFCKEHNFEFITINSNYYDFRETSFLSSHTYLTCSIVMSFQKKFSIYYYSSGYPVYDFKPEFDDPAYYDVFLLQTFSTKAIRFISSCSCMSRVDKVKTILNNQSFYKYLYVCTSGKITENCGKCEKCIRTMLEADSVGFLNSLSKAFNLSHFQKYRHLYIGYALRQKKKNVFYKEIIDSYRENSTVGLMTYLLYFIPSPLDLKRLKSSVNKIIRKITRK